MAAVPAWYTTGGTLISTSQSLSALAGTPGTALQVQIWNNKGGAGADPLKNARLKGLFREPGQTPYESSGLEWADQRWIEARLTGGLGGLTISATDWKPIGAGKFLEIPQLDNDRGVSVEIRVSAPADAQSDSIEWAIRVAIATSEALPEGATEATPDGIYIGLGDADQTVHAYNGGNVVENPGGADSNVQVQPAAWIAKGLAYAIRQQLVNVPAAAAGKARYDLLSLNTTGTVTRTAGSEVTPPLTSANKPALPAGHLALAYVNRDDTSAIQNADIENVAAVGLYAFSSSGLTATVGVGPMARVDNALCQNRASQSITLTASATNYVWLLRTGELAKTTTSAPPVARALLLHEADTNGSAVTAHRDRRFFVGYKPVQIRFEWLGTQVVGTYRYAVLPSERAAQLVPLMSIFAALGAQGNGTGGQTRYTVEVERSGSWVDLWATAADRPSIAYNAAPPVNNPVALFPDRFDLPSRCRLRAKATELPSGASSDPTDGVLILEAAV